MLNYIYPNRLGSLRGEPVSHKSCT